MDTAGSEAPALEPLERTTELERGPAYDEAADPVRRFVGPRVLAAAFLARMLSGATTFTAFGVFVVPLMEEFGSSRGRISSAFSAGLLVMGLMGPLVGRWVDRGRARALMTTGAVLAGLGLLAASRATELWQAGLLFCGVTCIGAAMFGSGPTMSLVTNWFVRRRGLALGIVISGSTVATFCVPTLTAWLVDQYGWRTAMLALGLSALCLGAPAFLGWVVARPEDIGQRPDGETGAEETEAPPAVETRDLLRDPNLWLVGLGFGLLFTSPVVLMVLLVPFAETTLGFSRVEATLFFSVMAPFALIGKLVFGALIDWISLRVAVLVSAVGNALVWAGLFTAPDYSVFLAIAAIYGLAMGTGGPLHGIFLARCFGREGFGRAAGFGGLVGIVLLPTAPALAAYLGETTGSDYAAIAVQGTLVLFSGLVLAAIPLPPEPAPVREPAAA